MTLCYKKLELLSIYGMCRIFGLLVKDQTFSCVLDENFSADTFRLASFHQSYFHMCSAPKGLLHYQLEDP